MTIQLQFPSTQTMVSTAATVAATAMLLRSLYRDYLPRELHHYLHSKLSQILTSLSSEITLIIDEFESLTHNHLFQSAHLYLKPQISPHTKRFKATMPPKEHNISVAVHRDEEITDTFNGIKFKWKLISKEIQSKYIQTSRSKYTSTMKSQIRHFELRFHKKHMETAVSEYLPHVLESAKEVKEERKTLKLFTLETNRMGRMRGDTWQSVVLDHASTFDTLAMDLEVKKMVIDDLDRFLERKSLYKSVGKAWKRGYLLYGPPGSGKSSLIAAMANYLNFDVYDLEITDLRRNSDLKKLLMATGNRSILVVEDIDCSLQLHHRLAKQPIRPMLPSHEPNDKKEPKVTLSGFLNFIDGLWSSCGDERIIVFTTNHKDKLDPALLRPGRMDVHIALSYCTPCGFKTLASNYLGITDHPLFSKVQQLLETTNVTPAEVGEHFLKNEDPEIALTSFINLLVEKGPSHQSKAIQPNRTTQ